MRAGIIQNVADRGSYGKGPDNTQIVTAIIHVSLASLAIPKYVKHRASGNIFRNKLYNVTPFWRILKGCSSETLSIHYKKAVNKNCGVLIEYKLENK